MATSKYILIVDDNVIVGHIYQRQFVMAGYEVKVVLDGEQALTALAERRPDVVLLDLQLPKISGIEVLKHIRTQPDLKTLPVVVFSNAYLGNLVKEAWQAGANKCLTKAICTPKQLMAVIHATLADGASSASAAVAQAAAEPEPVAAAPNTAFLPQELRATRRVLKPVAASMDPEMALQAEVRTEFLATCPDVFAVLRRRIQALAKAEGDPDAARRLGDRSATLFELYQRVHSLTGSAGASGLERIATMASAFEALLRELHAKPQDLNPSTLRTLANVVDFIGVLFKQADVGAVSMAAAAILVVDDDAISRRAVLAGLEKAGLTGTAEDDPFIALEKLAKNRYDLIILDVQMPGMSGFELCTKLRAMPQHAKTPVVFVTAMTDFQSRARSTLSGGNDLIAKPFPLIELAVKALTFVLRSQAPPPA